MLLLSIIQCENIQAHVDLLSTGILFALLLMEADWAIVLFFLYLDGFLSLFRFEGVCGPLIWSVYHKGEVTILCLVRSRYKCTVIYYFPNGYLTTSKIKGHMQNEKEKNRIKEEFIY